MSTIFDAAPGATQSGGGLVNLVKKKATQGLSVLGDLLSRPGAAFEHIYASPDSHHPDFGGAVNTIMHGAPAGQQDADRASIRAQLHAAGLYGRLPHWAQGAADAVIDTVADPTTFLGGSGLLESAVGHASPHLAAALAKTASRTAITRGLYDTGTHSGEAIRGIYGALPARKAQSLINRLETVARQERNLTDMGKEAAPHAGQQMGLLDLPRLPLEGAAKRREATALAQRFLRQSSLSKDERKAVSGAVQRYFVGQQRLPRSEFTKALVGGQSGLQKVVEATNLPMFAFPFRHMANITNLGMLRDPLGAAQTLGEKIGGAVNPEIKKANDALIRDYQERGLIGYAPERELEGSVNLLKAAGERIPALKPTTEKLGEIGHGLYKRSQNTLWNFDDLMRAKLIRRAVARGMSEEDAAHQVNRALVDYGMRSPATESLYDVAPFATFRTGIPGAVLRSLLQHPERGAIGDRLTGGTFTGGRMPEGGAGIDEQYLPSADVGRGALGDPMGYLRGTLSWPVQDVMSLGGDISAAALKHDPVMAKGAQAAGRYMTYGKSVFPYYDKKKHKWIPGVFPGQAIRVPGADDLLPFLNPFKSSGLLKDLLQSQAGIKTQ